jgi:hypothetical protein
MRSPYAGNSLILDRLYVIDVFIVPFTAWPKGSISVLCVSFCLVRTSVSSLFCRFAWGFPVFFYIGWRYPTEKLMTF